MTLLELHLTWLLTRIKVRGFRGGSSFAPPLLLFLSFLFHCFSSLFFSFSFPSVAFLSLFSSYSNLFPCFDFTSTSLPLSYLFSSHSSPFVAFLFIAFHLVSPFSYCLSFLVFSWSSFTSPQSLPFPLFPYMYLSFTLPFFPHSFFLSFISCLSFLSFISRFLSFLSRFFPFPPHHQSALRKPSPFSNGWVLVARQTK